MIRGYRARALRRTEVALIAALLGWVSLWSWRGLIEQPFRFINAALIGGILIAVTGGLLRARNVRWYLVLPAQLVVLTVWLQHRTTARSGLEAWIPTPGSLRAMVDAIGDGASAVNTYSSPVSVDQVTAVTYLIAVSLAVMLGVDLLGPGIGRMPWAGLPVVVSLTVPVSVLEENLSWVVLAICALTFVALLATDETDRVRTWARGSSPGADENGRSTGVRWGGGNTIRTAAARIGLTVTAGALVLPILVPVGDGFLGGGDGKGSGGGDNGPVRLVNPLVDLHRDLVLDDDIPLVTARTQDGDTNYLRLTVLDTFDGGRWRPSQRDLPARNKADGVMPNPPGLAPGTPGRAADWDITLTSDFQTSWLAAPYPLLSIEVPDGDWRFDDDTLDFARVSKESSAETRYSLTAYHPEVTAADLEGAARAPESLRSAMTALPGSLPPLVAQIAKEVTAPGATDYEKMVLLQNWFRRDGGFTYSLERDDGSTSDALTRFITTEKFGYCEQFAAAMTIMARTLGVPARVVIGFLRPQRQVGDTNEYVYTSNALHAWPEIYFTGVGWVRFEPTPGQRSGPAPSWTLRQTAPVPTPTSTPTATPSARPSQRPAPVPEAAGRTDAGGVPTRTIALSVLGLAVVLVLALPGTLRRRKRQERLAGTGVTRDRVAAGMWTELLATAIDAGVPFRAGRSIRRTAADLEEWAGRGKAGSLDRLVDLIERARYGRPGPADGNDMAAMRAEVVAWCAVMLENVPARARLVARVFPRSVLTKRERLDALLTVEPQRMAATAGEVR